MLHQYYAKSPAFANSNLLAQLSTPHSVQPPNIDMNSVCTHMSQVEMGDTVQPRKVDTSRAVATQGT